MAARDQESHVLQTAQDALSENTMKEGPLESAAKGAHSEKARKEEASMEKGEASVVKEEASAKKEEASVKEDSMVVVVKTDVHTERIPKGEVSVEKGEASAEKETDSVTVKEGHMEKGAREEVSSGSRDSEARAASTVVKGASTGRISTTSVMKRRAESTR